MKKVVERVRINITTTQTDTNYKKLFGYSKNTKQEDTNRLSGIEKRNESRTVINGASEQI